MLKFITIVLVALCWLAAPALADSSKGGLGTKNTGTPPVAGSGALHAPSSALSVHEGSSEYIISQAAKLNQGDDRQQLEQIQQQLRLLRAQAQALRAQIAGKQAAVASTEDADQRNHLQSEIAALQAQLQQVENQIAQLEAKAREIADRHDQGQQEGSDHPAVTLHPGAVQPLRHPLHIEQQ